MDDTADTSPTGDSGVDDTAADDTATGVEECNGLDDDGDGEVDEGYPDSDRDGTADCVDETCSVTRNSGYLVDAEASCASTFTAAADPWDVDVLWQVEASTTDICFARAVVDLDADGILDVVCGRGTDQTRAHSGVDGQVIWSTGEFVEASPVAVADLDGDGTMELVGYNEDDHLVAVSVEGEVLWESAADLLDRRAARTYIPGLSLVVADLDADGLPEVVANEGVVSGTTGAFLALLGEPSGGSAMSGSQQLEIAVADVDGDGEQDIMTNWQRFTPDGTQVYELEVPYRWDDALQPIVMQADDDEDGEVAWVSEEGIRVVDPDGTVLWEGSLYDTGGVPMACAGDVDGDGEMELVVHERLTVATYGPDGAGEWVIDLEDPTDGYGGCSVADLNGDGATEVLLSDSQSFYILDGESGAVLHQDDSWSSGTWGDYPVVVDLDGDGSVEIIAVNGTWSGVALSAYGHATRQWPPGVRAWPAPNWSGVGQLEDGTIERTPRRPWLDHALWRGQPVDGGGLNLAAEVVDSCVASCDDTGEVRLAVRLVNAGNRELVDGATLAIYALDAEGGRSLLEVVEHSDWLDDGWAGPTHELVLDTAQARLGVVLAAWDDGTGTSTFEDCDPGDDVVTWRLDDCD